MSAYIADIHVRSVFNDYRDWFVCEEDLKDEPRKTASVIIRVLYSKPLIPTLKKGAQFDVGLHPIYLNATSAIIRVQMIHEVEAMWGISYVGIRHEVNGGTMGHGTQNGKLCQFYNPEERCDETFVIRTLTKPHNS